MRFVTLLLLFLLMAPFCPAAEWQDLFPDEKLTGWTRVPIPAVSGVDPRMQWRVDTAQRVIVCVGDGGHEWLRHDKELGDVELRVEWRFVPRPGEPRYNSGIGIRLSKQGEIWHQAQTGQAGAFLFGDTLVNGALARVNLRDKMTENRIKPVGEWNLYEIRAVGDKITLAVNGGVVSELTGIALRKGYIGLEAEGYEIWFRNLKIRALD